MSAVFQSRILYRQANTGTSEITNFWEISVLRENVTFFGLIKRFIKVVYKCCNMFKNWLRGSLRERAQ